MDALIEGWTNIFLIEGGFCCGEVIEKKLGQSILLSAVIGKGGITGANSLLLEEDRVYPCCNGRVINVGEGIAITTTDEGTGFLIESWFSQEVQSDGAEFLVGITDKFTIAHEFSNEIVVAVNNCGALNFASCWSSLIKGELDSRNLRELSANLRKNGNAVIQKIHQFLLR